jgi:hypothetical protein
MKAARSIGGVVAGYLIFGLSAGILFQAAKVDPHAPASLTFMVLSTLYGAFFAAVGGYVAAWIAGWREFEHAVALALLIDLTALGSLVAVLGKGSVWSNIATVLVMAPTVLLGGWIRRKQATRRAAA